MAKTASDKPINVGIVGLGRAGWGMHTVELAKRPEKFAIVAGVDPKAERRKMLADKFKAATYRDLDGLLADDNVELVSIATLSPDHPAHAMAALKAGKMVLVEKPMATTLADAKKLVKFAQRYPGKLFVRHNRRFEGAFNHILQIIDSGILGEIHTIKLHRNNYQRRNDWQTILDAGGGQLLNWGPHIIDHALQYVNYEIDSLWSELKCIAAAGDAEDHIKILMRGKNGRVVDLEISGGTAIGEPQEMVFGSRGALTVQGGKINLKYLDPKKKLARIKATKATPSLEGGFGNKESLTWIEETIPVAPKPASQPDDIWDHLHATIRQGKPFRVKLTEALAVMEVVDRVSKNTPFARR